MTKTFKDFTLELSYYEGKNNYEKFIAFLSDLGNFADYHWDIPKMQYDLVMSKQEWEKFLSHPDRQPYQIGVLEWNSWSIEKIYERTLEVLAFGVTLYKSSKTQKDYAEQIKLSLPTILKGIVHSRYEDFEMDITDQYVGLNRRMRDSGELSITPIQLARFNYFTEIAALELGMSATIVREKLLRVCENDLARLGEFFMTCQFDDEIKNIYLAYRKAAASDKTIEDFNIILGYRIWKELVEHNIDIDTYLELLGYPKASEVKAKLLHVLTDPEITKEVLEHFKKERPESYKIWKKANSIPQMDISQEEARIFDNPKRLRSTEETERMITECKDTIAQYFPISTEESPRQLFFNAIHPFSVKRAYQSHTYTKDKKNLNITVMTPTSDSQHEYLETLAHETTHSIHSIILNRAVEYNQLTQTQADQVPSSVMEDFSQLIEGQFKQKIDTKEKAYHGKYYASFNQALSSRWQAPFGLVQIEIREQFEEWLKKGIVTLTPKMLDELRAKYDKKMDDWWTNGLNFTSDMRSSFFWLRPLSPYDALVYMKRFIVTAEQPKKVTSTKSNATMAQAFTKRFGEKWINDVDARILVYWLLLETGRDHQTQNYGTLIANKDVADCLVELAKIGIDASEFKLIE